VPHWSDVTASSRAGARQASVPFSRVPPSSFEGAACGPYESGRHSVTELTLALPHSVVQWRGWPHQGGGETAPRYDSQAVSEGRHGGDSPLTRAPAVCRSIKCSGRGSGCGSGGPARASSEAETRPRARISLERDGVSPEGGVQPSSEAESCPRGGAALERGGVSPEGARSPRARRSFTRGGVQPLSEAEFHPRGRPALERGGVSAVRRCPPRAKRSFTQGVLGPTARWAAEVAEAVGSCHQAVIVWGAIYSL
jgi:hypothetical protein